MARVASCPQCEHDLLVPDGTADDAWVKCPECRAFFELQGVKTRELPTVELADAHAAETALTSFHEPATPETPESPEAAAQRIDQWFRSAKTLEDLPPAAANAEPPQPETSVEPDDFAASEPSLDLTAGDDIANLDDDFELETPAEAASDPAAWDDSQHMDELLADFQHQPADKYEDAADNLSDSAERDDAEREQEQGNSEWSPEVPFVMPPGEPKRKRSLIRTMLVTVVGGIVGLALGYYALLWIRGPELDVLDVAKYLPKAALPPSFQKVAKSPIKPAPAPAPSTMAADLAASDKVVNSESAPETPSATEQPAEKQATFNEPVADTKTTTPNDDRYASPTPKTDTAPREPAPLETPPATALTDTAPRSEAPNQVRISDAPSFTLADLTASIQIANEAEATLAKGNLSDGREVQQTKGKSYMAIADMAQKAALVDATAASADVAKVEQQVDDLLRRTFADNHVREELTQIVPKWLNHPKRPHNGAILAGNVKHTENKGSVVEYTVDMGGGASTTILVPAAPGQQADQSTRPIAVAGWIVAKPGDQVAGYTGSAPQAVFAKRLVPLE
jgi:hypothetical protein